MKLKYIFASLIVIMILTMASAGTGPDSWSNTEKLTEDLEYSVGIFDDGERQEEHYITYHPGGNAVPCLWYGTSALGDKATFETAAFDIEAEGKRVLAGTNGDYFVLSSGQPVGIVISNGRLITSDDGNPALGFFEDGSAFFGTPQLQLGLTIRGSAYRLSGINRSIRKNGFFLYSSDYGSMVSTAKDTLNLILIPMGESVLSVGTELRFRVESAFTGQGGFKIPQDRFVLSLTTDSEEWRIKTMESLSAGEEVSVSISSDDPRWNDCVFATGSLYRLISGGMIAEELDRADKSRAPRTAVGIRNDGSILLYTIDGRQNPYSAGVTLNELAQRLQQLGCIEAGALDGGGSTVIYAQSAGEENATIRNSPSNGEEREVSTFLMLVSEGDGSGIGRTLSLRSDTTVLLCGSQLQVHVGICDEKGASVTPGGINWSTTDGTITDAGLYSAPDYACRSVVSASSSGLQGSMNIDIVRNPDSIRILAQDSHEELTRLELKRGETADLTAAATWGLMSIQAEDEQFIWTCTGNAGSIDGSGRFTASSNGGNGTVTVSAGDTSMTIGVFVKTAFTCIQDYEQIAGASYDGVNLSAENTLSRVRFGRGSLRMDYDLSSGEVTYPLQWNRQEKAQYLYLWVYGDGSGNRLSAVIGSRTEFLALLDDQGWKLLQIDTGYGGIDALTIQGQGSGTIWIDQVLVSNADTPDLEPPEIALHTNGTQITARIYDQADGTLDGGTIELTVDGGRIPFTYDAVSGTLKTVISDDGLLHRITVTAKDSSGNLNSASVMLQGMTENPFQDMTGHWAAEYAGYLYGRGIFAGRDTPEGLQFDPNTPVTRAEFAVLLSRWQGLNGSKSEGVEFADADQIPDWALDSVYAVSEKGLIQGEQEGSTLWFRPLEPLTRAQAAAILGRTLEGGRLYADLIFRDAETIPDWSAPYVSLLCAMGVLNGFEDETFRPDGTLTRAQAAKLLTMMS